MAIRRITMQPLCGEHTKQTIFQIFRVREQNDLYRNLFSKYIKAYNATSRIDTIYRFEDEECKNFLTMFYIFIVV